ncbi:MAG: DNA mismatch repair endonuclease MutL [Kosmotoga sp.]|nr:MAG: DNA mismatch repair endonuclease MutL [Kosmotoga sp.]
MAIRILSQDIVRKIAAGEVVTGAFSVIKELIENSLDAEATQIDIWAKNGGKEYISVADNGVGMNSDDLKLAIKPHTTSKIERFSDLDNLVSYGFRGEALSTIASVSRMKISSRSENDDLGLLLEIASGQIKKEQPVSRDIGTTVEVYDLLFNTPARRKFLKSKAVEGRMITETVERFVLSHSGIGFKYLRDDKLIYDISPTSTIIERITQLFPEIKSGELIEIEDKVQMPGISVNGFIVMPNKTRPNRLGEMIFVNGRYVKQPVLNFSVEQGYAESLEKGRFPYCFIFLKLSPDQIDVNIHPQKLEVKFSNTTQVKKALSKTIRETLRSKGNFSIRIEKREREKESYQSFNNRKEGSKEPRMVKERFNEENVLSRKRNEHFNLPMEVERNFFRHLKREKEEDNDIENVEVIGVLGERYIIAEVDEGLLIIDLHAAHERITYEKLNETNEVSSQNLLQPITISLNNTSMEIVKDFKTLLNEFGFYFDVHSDKIMLKSIPYVLDSNNLENSFRDIVDELRLGVFKNKKELRKAVMAEIACKTSFRTGDMLNLEQAEALISELKKRKLLVCPHGRPLTMLLKFPDLDNYFSR